jgi:hypothetical protein
MHELPTESRPKAELLRTRGARLARRLAAAALLGVGFLVTLATASVIALAALVIALLVAAGMGAMWVLARLAGPRRSGQSSLRTLEARKGPRGWTVETRRFSF